MRKTKILLLCAALLIPSTITAAPLTSCSGSWDGPLVTGCQLLGAPGEIGLQIDFNEYIATDVLYAITAWEEGASLSTNADGTLSYSNLYRTYNSKTDATQFAYWLYPDGSVVAGVEDIPQWWVNNDRDFNDYMRRYVPKPAQSVPETGTMLMSLIGVASVFTLRRRLAPARLQ